MQRQYCRNKRKLGPPRAPPEKKGEAKAPPASPVPPPMVQGRKLELDQGRRMNLG